MRADRHRGFVDVSLLLSRFKKKTDHKPAKPNKIKQTKMCQTEKCTKKEQ